jgi:hypothetical protein
MSAAAATTMGNDSRGNVLPVKPASGPGFLGPSYNPADEMLPPAAIGVRRGGDLGDVLDAVKGVVYYGDMIGFGAPSSAFTQGKPGLRPLGVDYFINSGLTCSNGAIMWEFVQTVPDGSALGDKIKDALAGVGLPALRGMGPGMLEDVKFALNPAPVINAVVGSGYPQCKLVKKQVGDVDGNIQNVDGVLLVDPEGIMSPNGKAPFFQERWVQDMTTPVRRPNESEASAANRAEPKQLSYESWSAEPKIYKENGCRVDPNGTEDQPQFCNPKLKSQIVKLGDGSTVTTYIEGFTNYEPAAFNQQKMPHAVVSLSVAVISVLCLISFWGSQRK